jgi:hypothetical protein
MNQHAWKNAIYYTPRSEKYFFLIQKPAALRGSLIFETCFYKVIRSHSHIIQSLLEEFIHNKGRGKHLKSFRKVKDDSFLVYI